MDSVLPLSHARETAASIDLLVRSTADDMVRVNQFIVSKTNSDVPMIPQIAKHLISSGGKRLRPMLTLAAAQLCGYQGDGHINLAASIEFMHTATLLHDDVIDESDMRRGKETARIVWGNQASVLVGDFLLGQAFKMMIDVGSLDALKLLSKASMIIAEGEVMQLASARSMETTEDDYLVVIQAKTATLFSAAAEVGPILAQSDKNVRDAFRVYGLNLGIAFQLVDDALDYSGSKDNLGKNIGDDFQEGKITLPVLLAYRRGGESERKFWKKAMESDATCADKMDEAMILLRKHGAISDTVERARHYGKIARDALSEFPQSMRKQALLDVVEFCVSRIN
ncbi:polyprenyl synthetase family protein [Candidatus Endowatersipora endosymbiont of Watersipora subatra]|uniref:polyprenyl synthetase family protein n=1 Tax=Candidatus Endowatersipora endosymbiont of Watersipora subatra TaxID=3077946 RepID=UPI00312C8CC3